jgi:hypothetical protein
MARAVETVVVKTIVRNITEKGFWIGDGGPRWGHDRNIFVARSQIVDADCDLDDVTIGEEIEIEIPAWLARRFENETDNNRRNGQGVRRRSIGDDLRDDGWDRCRGGNRK